MFALANTEQPFCKTFIVSAFAFAAALASLFQQDFARKSSLFSARIDSAEGEAFHVFEFNLVRRSLLLDVLASNGYRHSAAASKKVTERPPHIAHPFFLDTWTPSSS